MLLELHLQKHSMNRCLLLQETVAADTHRSLLRKPQAQLQTLVDTFTKKCEELRAKRRFLQNKLRELRTPASTHVSLDPQTIAGDASLIVVDTSDPADCVDQGVARTSAASSDEDAALQQPQQR